MNDKHNFNFCAGPAVIADEVLEKAQKALVNYNNTGMSILSISHRSSEFMGLMHKAIADVRDLLSVPDNYEPNLQGVRKLKHPLNWFPYGF